MSRRQLSRTPANFPRMRYRARKRHQRRFAPYVDAIVDIVLHEMRRHLLLPAPSTPTNADRIVDVSIRALDLRRVRFGLPPL